MRSDASIRNVVRAAILRHAVDIDGWQHTSICEDASWGVVKPEEEELSLVRVQQDEANWTLITTRRILGRYQGSGREQMLDDLDDVVFGLPRSIDATYGVFRTIDHHGEQRDFLLEARNARQACVEAIRVVLGILRKLDDDDL